MHIAERFIEIIIFLWGLCIGSFLNVCIFRIPAAQSIVRPRSACPQCQTPIRFYDNIPILSYMWLKGRCRDCGQKIALRYPLVELLTGCLAWGTYFKFGLTVTGLIYFAFIAALVVITFIDLDHRIIPDFITLPGIPLFLAASMVIPTITLLESIVGVLAGGGSLLAVAWTYKMITHKDGMGGGDIKLLAMIGALLGWQGVLLTIFVASAVGTLAGFAHMIQVRQKNMKLAIPFGPFLAIGALVYIFWGERLIRWYIYAL
jgi:leader peptidase (prepilin peptidase)/N-methyltransferase